MASSSNIQTGLKSVNENIQRALEKRPKGYPNVRLVAVSKTKPVENIIAAYECGQRHFGENYMNELDEKSQDKNIIENCKDIQWHFIGHLQGKKIKKLVAIPNLYMMETVHSVKTAETLQSSLLKLGRKDKLKVMIQVNTSDEDNKNGIPPSEAADLVKLIITDCTTLEFSGLMTIGALNHSLADGENPDFLKLIKCREDVCAKCNLKIEDVELSMGMSNDYEHAIELGSTNVRVGSTIFGAREPPKQKDTQQHTSEQPSQQAKSEDTVLQNNTETSSEKQENDEVLKHFQKVAL